MKLSDSEIKRRMFIKGREQIIISPEPGSHCIQPTSVDLHLSSTLRLYPVPVRGRRLVLDPEAGAETREKHFTTHELEPGDFLLASTLEHITIPSDLVAIVEGKSSLGRVGLAVHITAGFIDPGFKGNITLELKNVNAHPIKLTAGMAICQLCFEPILGTVERPYGSAGLRSRYQDSKGTIGARRLRRQEGTR
jgi:dCTP deaminase